MSAQNLCVRGHMGEGRAKGPMFESIAFFSIDFTRCYVEVLSHFYYSSGALGVFNILFSKI